MYVGDMVTLLARLDVESVDWVGTSLGGLVGMALAALPGSPMTRLVLNDVGPVVTTHRSPASAATSASGRRFRRWRRPRLTFAASARRSARIPMPSGGS